MADTQRSLATLQALLANNATGDIDPVDVRDMLVSLQADHGEIYISATTATTFADAISFVPVAGTWTLSANNHLWEMAVNGQLKYTGPADRVVHIAASVSMTSNANNQVLEIVVSKNGVAIAPSMVERKIGTGADVGSTALHAFTTVSTNDYLTVEVKNTSWIAAQTVTFTTTNLFAMGMIV